MAILKTLACAGTIALLSAPAIAQDSTTDQFDWAGFYAGLHLGYGWNKVGNYYDYLDPAFVPGTFQDARSTFGSGLGGVQIGHNWENDRFVYGVEADITLSGASLQFVDIDPSIGAWSIQNTLNGTATLRARIGYDFGNTLAYATGGLAAASLTTRQSVSIGGGGGPDPFQTNTNVHLGYAIGVGFEQAVSDTLSIKAEYMYFGLGDQTFSANYGNITNSLSSHSVRIGLNHHF